MKKFLGIMFVALFALLAVSTARAESYVYSFSYPQTGVTAIASAALPINGYVDKIEISQNAQATSTVVVASYDVNGTAIDTLVSASANSADTLVVRPRFVGTSTAGVALTAATTTTASYYATVLSVPYERAMVRGNVKVVVTPDGVGVGLTNTMTVAVFYQPAK